VAFAVVLLDLLLGVANLIGQRQQPWFLCVAVTQNLLDRFRVFEREGQLDHSIHHLSVRVCDRFTTFVIIGVSRIGCVAMLMF